MVKVSPLGEDSDMFSFAIYQIGVFDEDVFLHQPEMDRTHEPE